MKFLLRLKRDEANDETDDEQPETTDIPNLENEKSAKHRRQGMKLLIPDQMLSRYQFV